MTRKSRLERVFHRRPFGNLWPCLMLGGVLLKDALNHFSLGYISLALVGIGGLGCIAVALISGRLRIILRGWTGSFALLMSVGFVLSNAISLTSLGRFNASPFYISFFLAIIIVASGFRWYFLIFLSVPAINVALQLFETLSGSILFITLDTLNDSVLDSESWNIADGELRTKGLFQGPLHIVSICLLALLIRPKSTAIHVLFVIATYLAGARLGMLVSILLLAHLIASRQNHRKVQLKRIAIAIISMVAAILVSLNIDALLGDRVAFFAKAFDFDEDGSNFARISAWLSSIDLYTSYSVSGLLFGQYDQIRTQTILGSSESDWLRLLVDNGFFGFALYATAAWRIVKSLRTSRFQAHKKIALTIFLVMNLYPCIGWTAAAMSFWVIFFWLELQTAPQSAALQVRTALLETQAPPRIQSHST